MHSPSEYIRVRGAREHNLQNVSLDVPKRRLVVFTGPSGSGKSSLAFDTIFAEGQRRYLESFSAYLRQMLGVLRKADVDAVENLSPAISIDQSAASNNPRSTVGTISEVYDYLRLAYGNVGTARCPDCGEEATPLTVDQIVADVQAYAVRRRAHSSSAAALRDVLMVVAPIAAASRRGSHHAIAPESYMKQGFSRLRVDGVVMRIDEFARSTLKAHRLELVIDRLTGPDGLVDASGAVATEEALRLAEAIRTGMAVGDGVVSVVFEGGGAAATSETRTYSERFACRRHGPLALSELSPRLFSFSSPLGACTACDGIGVVTGFTEASVVRDPSLPASRAIEPLATYSAAAAAYYRDAIRQVVRTAISPETSENGMGERSSPAAVGTAPTTAAASMGADAATDSLTATVPPAAGDALSAAHDRSPHPNPPEPRWRDLPSDLRHRVLWGDPSSLWPGALPALETQYREARHPARRRRLEPYRVSAPCSACYGHRLNRLALAVTLGSAGAERFRWTDLVHCDLVECRERLLRLKHSLSEREALIAAAPLDEVLSRLAFMISVGLGYLSLDRAAGTLSGGESRRLKLANRVGSRLTDVLYVLDEPTVGLHARDIGRLLDALEVLRDLGNSVLVVEHDEAAIRRADYIVDIGPGAGPHGGHVVAHGTLVDIERAADRSDTGAYLSGRKRIPTPAQRRAGHGFRLVFRGARANNLREVELSMPLGTLTVISGVSGSGKSSALMGVIAHAMREVLAEAGPRSRPRGGNRERVVPDPYTFGMRYTSSSSSSSSSSSPVLPPLDSVSGHCGHIDRVEVVDQEPIGRTPRSNAATYTGAFDIIRQCFARTAEASVRGLDAGAFSFNKRGGRCEACEGQGFNTVSMLFLPDVLVPCASCGGRRYSQTALSVHYRGKSVAEVLDMTCAEAHQFFGHLPVAAARLGALCDVGLGYMRLGQPAPTLSGGEAQRVKLAAELGKRSTGRTLYLMDEVTTGLSTADVHRLLQVLHRLVERGNTIVMIEHHLDVLRNADWIIDLGPEGGRNGGQVVCSGTPEQVARVPHSHTGRYLRQVLAEPTAASAAGVAV